MCVRFLIEASCGLVVNPGSSRWPSTLPVIALGLAQRIAVECHVIAGSSEAGQVSHASALSSANSGRDVRAPETQSGQSSRFWFAEAVHA